MKYRSVFILPITIRDLGNELASQIGIDPEALQNTLSVPIVPADSSDDVEPTHFACCGILSETQREALESASSQFPGAIWFRWNETDGKLAASWNGQDLGEPYSWDKCLSVSQLKRKVQPI